jgi:F0F1-type ATP synthase assembly protein I
VLHSTRVVIALVASFIFLSSVEAGVHTLVDSMAASNTLAILLLLGVIAGILDTFGNSGSSSELRIFGSPADSSSSGSSTVFP